MTSCPETPHEAATQMQTFENQTVSRNYCTVRFGPEERQNAIHVTRNVTVEDVTLVNCELIGEGLTTYGAPVNRSTARNVQLRNCRVNSFFGNGAVFDEVNIDGLRTSAMPAILNACVFRHVALRGEIGRFLFNSNVCHDDDVRNNEFRAANARFYGDIDWALDISNAKASCIEIRGSIPSALIRRNPDEQFVMTREVAEGERWRDYEPFESFEIAVSTFLGSDGNDNVFVAARRSRHFKTELSFYQRLRAAGLVS